MSFKQTPPPKKIIIIIIKYQKATTKSNQPYKQQSNIQFTSQKHIKDKNIRGKRFPAYANDKSNSPIS